MDWCSTFTLVGIGARIKEMRLILFCSNSSPKSVRVSGCRRKRNSPLSLFLRIRACVTIQNIGLVEPESE